MVKDEVLKPYRRAEKVRAVKIASITVNQDTSATIVPEGGGEPFTTQPGFLMSYHPTGGDAGYYAEQDDPHIGVFQWWSPSASFEGRFKSYELEG